MTRQGSSFEGPIPFILDGAAKTCCPQCHNGLNATIDYEHDKNGVAAEKTSMLTSKKIENEAEMSFPIEGYQGQNAYGIYRYVPLMESGGVALVGTLPTIEENASFMIMVGTTCFPMALLAFLMIMIAGWVIWFLVSLLLVFLGHQ